MQAYRVKSIGEFHRYSNLPKPEHPLVSVVDLADMKPDATSGQLNVVLDYYSISMKRNVSNFRYGQKESDFEEGVMFFIAPGQVISTTVEHGDDKRPSGWLLLVHPDFLWNTQLAVCIKKYGFFDYSVDEALFLSEKEEQIITGILQNIRQEYKSNIDRFSQDIIVSQLETLLNYAERFYQRQFITRKKTNHQLLDRLEELLNMYLDRDDLIEKGLPSVEYISTNLNVSAAYLRSLVSGLTGQNTQQLIHDKVIERAKQKLSTTSLSVAEIAYGLGFEHSQSFNRLFKLKTKQSPLEFRQAFN